MFDFKREMIFVFTGPDGSGRKTVADMVGRTLGLSKVLSYTTRSPRSGEVDGQDYHFISRDEFLEFKANGDFIEDVEIKGNLFGIKKQDIDYMFAHLDYFYLILNAQGAKVLKDKFGDKVIRIFIYLDKDTIVERQKLANSSAELIQQHIDHYEDDMSYKAACKYAVENIDLAHTVFSVTNIMENYLQRDLVEKD
jgi:guanylate kinase